MYLLVSAGSLACKLVAGDVYDLQSFIMIFPLHFLKLFVVRCKSAACGGIYYDHDLALIIA